MQRLAERSRIAFLAGAMLAGTALPGLAQSEPQDLASHIRANAPQEYVLARCAGFFKALMIGNTGADENLKENARQTIEWFFKGIITISLKGSDGDVGPIAAKAAADIDSEAQFYLDRMLASIAETGKPFDDLLARDQNVCLVMASQRQAE